MKILVKVKIKSKAIIKEKVRVKGRNDFEMKAKTFSCVSLI